MRVNAPIINDEWTRKKLDCTKMRPTANPDESVTSNRSAHTASHGIYPSQGRKEQISGSGNAQTKYETHLSQNDAHSSTYGSMRPLDWHVANRAWCVYASMMEDQPSVPESFDGASQEHKGVDTRDVGPPRGYQSVNTDEEGYVKPHLWCARCYRRKKKKCRELELRESTRRLLERIKKRSKESEKLDDEVVAGVSTAPHRESISRPSVPEKPKRSRKQDAPVEVADKDVTGKTRKERKVQRDERQERRRRERKEKERQERRERREREERIPRVVDAQPPAPADFLKSCCYLCAQNTLAIAAAAGLKPEQSDKYVQVSAHQLHARTPVLDKSCSTILLVRTVQSSVKVKTRETSTLCPGTSARRNDTKTKRKKLNVFPRLTWTKCPARRHVACETDKSARRDHVEKRERAKNERCCEARRTTPDTL